MQDEEAAADSSENEVRRERTMEDGLSLFHSTFVSLITPLVPTTDEFDRALSAMMSESVEASRLQGRRVETQMSLPMSLLKRRSTHTSSHRSL
jgi:hypothetical protein